MEDCVLQIIRNFYLIKVIEQIENIWYKYNNDETHFYFIIIVLLSDLRTFHKKIY